MADIVEKLLIDRHTPREESVWRKIAKDAATEIIFLREALTDITKDGPIWRAQRIARETLARVTAGQRSET